MPVCHYYCVPVCHYYCVPLSHYWLQRSFSFFFFAYSWGFKLLSTSVSEYLLICLLWDLEQRSSSLGTWIFLSVKLREQYKFHVDLFWGLNELTGVEYPRLCEAGELLLFLLLTLWITGWYWLTFDCALTFLYISKSSTVTCMHVPLGNLLPYDLRYSVPLYYLTLQS